MKVKSLTFSPLKGKPSLPVPFSTVIPEHTLSTVHCFDIFRIFPQRSKFSSGAGEEPQSLWYPKHRAFLSQVLGNMQGSSAASITGIYKHEESLNRKLETVARGLFFFLFNSSCYHWSVDEVACHYHIALHCLSYFSIVSNSGVLVTPLQWNLCKWLFLNLCLLQSEDIFPVTTCMPPLIWFLPYTAKFTFSGY